MSSYDNREDDELEELAEQFKQVADNDVPTYFDADEYEDVIGFFLDTGDLTYAQKALQRAVADFPNELYFHLQYAKYYALSMDVDMAMREFDYIESHYEPIPEFYVEKVIVAHAFNLPINGLELLQKALNLDDEMPEAHLLLAHEYLLIDDLDQAVQHASRAIKLDESAADDLKIAMIDLQISQQNDLLIDFYEKMTQIFPMNGNLWSGLGVVYMSHNEFERAIEAFQFQLSLDEDDAMAYVNMAEAYFAAEDYQNALQYFKIAKEKCDVLQFNIQMGRCYQMLQDYEMAMHYFMQAHEEDPLFAFVISDIVKVFCAQEKYDEARTYLRQLIYKDPKNILALEELINLLNPQKDDDEIRYLCELALNLESYPKYAFLNSFAFYCCHTEGADLGIEICLNYLDDRDVCTNVHYFMAALYMDKGQIQKGCEYLELALQADPNFCQTDFEEMNPDFKEIPEVADLIRIYRDENDTTQYN